MSDKPVSSDEKQGVFIAGEDEILAMSWLLERVMGAYHACGDCYVILRVSGGSKMFVDSVLTHHPLRNSLGDVEDGLDDE